MPEGDTVFRAAQRLNTALAGRVVTGWDLRVPAHATSDLVGESVESVVPRGKHLLLRVGEFSLHTHLKMEGSWELFAPGQRWTKPAFKARAIVRVAEAEAVGFELGLVELLRRGDEDAAVGYLGPDLLGDDWDVAAAITNLAAHPEVPVHVALLDQRNLAGLGNVYANEVCFIRGVRPDRPIGETDIPALVATAYRAIHANLNRPMRVTTGIARRGQNLWVYGREHKPCRRCGTPIQLMHIGADPTAERNAFFCPHCQR